MSDKQPPPDNTRDDRGSTRNEGPSKGSPDNRKNPPGNSHGNERKGR